MSPRRQALTAFSVLAVATALAGVALAASSSRLAGPGTPFAGTASPGGTPSSSFKGSGTAGGGGGGFGDDSGGEGGGEGDGGGGLGILSSGPGGALSGLSVAAVRQLQTDLARLGYFQHAVTGYYGAVTSAAVKKFQRSAGLKADGMWGRRSATALQKRLAG